MLRLRGMLGFRTATYLCGLVLCAACRTTASSEARADTSKSSTLAAPAKPVPARVVLTPTGRDTVSVEVEVAETPAAREQGLMYRKQLAPSAGMLFIFDHPEAHTFWMHNTLVPLDIIFITSEWTVLGIVENATPLTDAPRRVPGESRYVLEVNAGFSRRYGLQAGTSVHYLPAAPGS